MDALRNRHAADRLADVRAELRRLEAEEDELRAELMVAPDADRQGEEWAASVSAYAQQRIDLEAAVAALGEETLRPFMRRRVFRQVRLRRRPRAAFGGEAA
jgi:hypothetical protein